MAVLCTQSHGQGSKKAFSVELYDRTLLFFCNPDILPSFMIATERNWKFASVARSSLWKSLHVCRGFRGMHSSGGKATRSVQWNRNGIAELSTNVCSSYPIWHYASTLDLNQTDKKQKCRTRPLHPSFAPTLSSSHTHDGL